MDQQIKFYINQLSNTSLQGDATFTTEQGKCYDKEWIQILLIQKHSFQACMILFGFILHVLFYEDHI
jgi:hypothetical protein